jgi:Flp pilus assembly protein TadD
MLDNFKEALASFEKALQLAPDSAYVWALKGNCLEKLGRIKEAKKAWYWNLFLKMLSTMSRYRHLLHLEDRYVMLDL